MKSDTKNRIKELLEELSGMLSDLDLICPDYYDAYCDIKTKAACERYFEKIIESCISVSYLLLKHKKRSEHIFISLSELSILSHELAIRLSDAKGMRNFIVHQYALIDDELVYETIKDRLFEDVTDFIQSIDEYIK